MTVGERLKEWRGALSQKAASLACGIKQQAWNRWEKNETEPGADSIRKICAYFGRTSDELLGIDRAPSAVTVNGSGNAVATGAHSVAIAGSSSAPGKFAACSKCPHLKKLKMLEKVLGK